MNLYDLTMKISFTIIFYDWNLLENRFQVETQRNEKPVQYEGYAEVVSRSREYVIQPEGWIRITEVETKHFNTN